MMYFVVIGILAVMWDICAINLYPHHDYTVSEFVYKLIHRYPVIGIVAGGAILYYFPNDIKPIVVGILIGHFTWKA